MKRFRLAWFPVFCLLFILLPAVALSGATRQANDPVEEAASSRGTMPTVLAGDDVQRIDVEGAKAWWWWTKRCPTTLAASGERRAVEEIARSPTMGGPNRTVYTHRVDSIACGLWDPELLSNVVADPEHIFWMSGGYKGLVRLSVEANEGDEPSLVYDGHNSADEIIEQGDYVWIMDDSYGIYRIHKTTGAASNIVTPAQLGGPARDLQIDEDFIYWNQNGFLKFNVAHGGPGGEITTDTTAYVPDTPLCFESPCTDDYVLVATGEQIRRYNITDNEWGPLLYDSPAGGFIRDIVADPHFIYFFEGREASCNPVCRYNYGLYRMPTYGSTPDLLYTVQHAWPATFEFDLALGGPYDSYIFWTDNGQLKRLPRDAEAIPSIDIAITGVEVSQAIQDLNNSIQLIQDKRTGVRVHVNAAGANVPGVTARLYRLTNNGTVMGPPIYPSSRTYYLTVPDNPDRANFDHAFYFELPPEWLSGETLRLRAQVNHTQIPPEPNFANNTLTTTTFNLRASPTLRAQLIVWGYTVDGTYYQPDSWQDVAQARSWIRRVYPLASNTGGYDSPDPGFRLKVRTINDPNLGAHVERTSDFCLDIPADDREFCAATYANNFAHWLKATEGIPASEMVYSMIWEEPALPFPRGFATGNVSTGPTGRGTWGWDNDGSYGDWYMGHEVGHNAGRAHPSPASDNPNTDNVVEGCGHSRSDNNFPYAGAAIGTGSLWGLDVGATGLNSDLVPRVYPNTLWTDMMSYCDRLWISDYTYEGIYDFLATSARPEQPPRPARAGTDYIALFGTIYDASDTAAFQVVGMWDSPGPYSPPSGGPFRMRFLDGQGEQLASYDFTGDQSDAEPSHYGFQVVVPFPGDTRRIELLRTSDSALLATHLVSANPPTIGNVQLLDAADPVSGIVTLDWQASDPDGDPLTFDVYYTRDNGATYTAYALALSESEVQLDTSQMGGSTQARFRITANDGTRMAEAESPTFTMANKPPLVTILSPQDGLEVRYGTAINFMAEVEDLQGHIPDANMRWYIDGTGTRVTGPNYTAYLLPVGTHVVSLRATNSQGQSTETGVTVIVNDELDYPGPTLSVGPDQLGWQVEQGATSEQQGTLTITNLGTGNLSWTASEDAPWLTLDVSEGEAPGVLTVTANPNLVEPGTPVSTHITITGNNGQSLVIPVSLTVGVAPVWQDEMAPPSTMDHRLFVPINLR